MKRFCFLVSFIVISFCSAAQYVYQIKADSVRIHNDSCKAELILENSTRHINGFLYNKGNGRTEFRKALAKINDSIYVIGVDTLKLNHTSGNTNSFIQNQIVAAQNGGFWINGSGRVDGVFTANQILGPLAINEMPGINNYTRRLWLLGDEEGAQLNIGKNFQGAYSSTGTNVLITHPNGVNLVIGHTATSAWNFTRNPQTGDGRFYNTQNGVDNIILYAQDKNIGIGKDLYLNNNGKQFQFGEGDISFEGNTYTNGNAYISNQLEVTQQAKFNSSQVVNRVVATSAITLNDTHYYVAANATGGAFTIQLPNAATCFGRVYKLKKIDTSANKITIDPNGAQTIDGQSTYQLQTQWQIITIISNGTDWEVI